MPLHRHPLFGLLSLLTLCACSSADPTPPATSPPDQGTRPEGDMTHVTASDAHMMGDVDDATLAHADVTAVQVSGSPGAYTFAVTLESPDTGCAQYAEWWEVLTPRGELLYRRILGHSHVDEQPFTRSGGPIAAQPGARVIVRAHMNTTGYGGQVLEVTLGSLAITAELAEDFARDVEAQAPQPEGCAF